MPTLPFLVAGVQFQNHLDVVLARHGRGQGNMQQPQPRGAQLNAGDPECYPRIESGLRHKSKMLEESRRLGLILTPWSGFSSSTLCVCRDIRAGYGEA